MAETRREGCLRYGCLGCLGLIAVALVALAISAGLGWNAARSQQTQEEVLTPEIPATPPPAAAGGESAETWEAVREPVSPAGRVILDLENGDFHVRPGRPGEPLRVKATYDSSSFRLEETLEEPPGEPWTYRLAFRQTGSGLLIGLSRIFGGSTPRIEVFLPADVPLALDATMESGGLAMDIGGLWLARADLNLQKGGVQLRADEPLKAPMESLSLRGRMGGFQIQDLGNASPRKLDVDFQMGGLQLDLTGHWVADAEIRIAAVMAGAIVVLPDDVIIQGVEGAAPAPVELEGSLPTLSFSTSVGQMGEIEFRGAGVRPSEDR
ncbi:MAG: hypothetical protein PVF68_03465 [Acidobacteriota bacterium]